VDGTEINTVSRSFSKKLLVTGTDSQTVKLFKSPSVFVNSEFKSFIGHASHVTRVRFTPKDLFLVSTGGNDKTSIVWRVTEEENDEAESDSEEDFVAPKRMGDEQ